MHLVGWFIWMCEDARTYKPYIFKNYFTLRSLLYGRENLVLTPREGYRRRAFLNKLIRWTFSLREKKSEEDWKYGIISRSSQHFTRVMESIWDGRKLTVAQGVSRPPFTAKASLQSLPSSHVIFVWAKWHWARLFSEYFFFRLPVSLNQITIFTHSPITEATPSL